jgi:hypothetical protein|tara:strand:- start:796 stop:1326 length:531 start_codon:yes stop_codon:yes gene_type:complete
VPSDTHLSPIARSAWCLALIDSCIPHLTLEESETASNFDHWKKAISKLRAFISGELKSESNLERFYNAFSDWEATFENTDSLNGRISALVFSATHTAFAALFDEDSDDTSLIRGNINDLHQELEALGGDGEGLADYWKELDSEWTSALSNVKQRPISGAILRSLADVDTSPFGLSS